MKQFLLPTFFIVFLMGISHAQITIQQADFKLSSTARDSQPARMMKKADAVIPTKGVNQTWDYSALRDSNVGLFLADFTTEPATTPRPAVYNNANLQANHFVRIFININLNIPARSYFQYNSTGFGFMGDSLSSIRFSLQPITTVAGDSLTIPAQVRRFDETLYRYRFPMTMSSSWAFSTGTTTNFALKLTAFGLNNTPGQLVRYYAVKDSIVGWGTLKLRNTETGAMLNFNTLMHRRVETGQDSFYIGGLPAPPVLLNAFGLVQGQRDTVVTYRFIGTGFKAQYLGFIVNNAETQIQAIFRGILPDLGLGVSNKEIANLEVPTTVFPNPATEGVTFEFNKTSPGDWRMFVYNATGQIIKNDYINAPSGKTQHTTHFDKSLPSGTYFYQIIDDNSLIRNTGKVMLMTN